MNAFVLGAGLGTRLRPLTNRRPKPLIPVANRPLIEYAFDHLIDAGVKKIAVNTHWRPEAYDLAFPQDARPGASSYRDVPLSFRREWPEILETAGGIKNVQDLMGDETFWVYNGDILSTLPLAPALHAHRAAGNEVTLVLRSRGGPLQVAFDPKSGRLTDIGGRVDASAAPRYLFTGIYLVEPIFFARIPAATKISVVPIFCDMIRSGAKLGAVLMDDGDWWDLGAREQYLAVHRALPHTAPWIAPGATVDASAQVLGASAIGEGASIGAGARLTDCMVWDRAEVAPGAVLERCIVTSGARATGALTDADVVPNTES
jgi:mannose-1-phosphate guanylyltransferase